MPRGRLPSMSRGRPLTGFPCPSPGMPPSSCSLGLSMVSFPILGGGHGWTGGFWPKARAWDSAASTSALGRLLFPRSVDGVPRGQDSSRVGGGGGKSALATKRLHQGAHTQAPDGAGRASLLRMFRSLCVLCRHPHLPLLQLPSPHLSHTHSDGKRCSPRGAAPEVQPRPARALSMHHCPAVKRAMRCEQVCAEGSR